MSTALDIITDALQELGIVGAGQAVAPEDAALGLRRLNQRLQVWANSPYSAPVMTEISVTLNGAASYTIGPTGTTVAVRPLRVQRATSTDAGGVEYGCNVLSRPQWDAITVKDVSGGPPCDIWYDAKLTDGRVYVYPKSSGYTLKLECLALLTSFPTLATAVTLPEGYETGLSLTLADDMAPVYGKQLSADTRRRCAGALRAIKRTNSELLLLVNELGAQPEYRIERGY